MSTSRAQSRRDRKRAADNCGRRIARRLGERDWPAQDRPMLRAGAGTIRYEVSPRMRGMAGGGIGALHILARRVGLVAAIDADLHLLKVHLPYHESDHVLSVAYNVLMGGTCLEDMELLRNNEAYLDALGAQRIPDPTTAGDFCRRFDEVDLETLMNLINEVRLRVWRAQPVSFFDEAIIDVDGTLAPTTGACKQGMDINYKGEWGYHPLLVSLANTGEPLFVVNRSGSRPSHEGAAERIDAAVELCFRAGFRKVTVRGDTDFTQTGHLDRWADDRRVTFVFGMDAMPKLKALADDLPEGAWKSLVRREKPAIRTEPRRRPENVKERIVREREFENIRLGSEDVAEFDYRPGKCARSYRVVAVKKNLSIERGETALFDDVRYFFYITNDGQRPAGEIVFSANDRCNQENLIEQLKNGVRALQAPVDTLVANGAYMVMASLAWTLKAWMALLLPEGGRWAEKRRAEKQTLLKMEFKGFVNSLMRLPCQIVKTGRRIVYRLLSWNPWQQVLLRLVDRLQDGTVLGRGEAVAQARPGRTRRRSAPPSLISIALGLPLRC